MKIFALTTLFSSIIKQRFPKDKLTTNIDLYLIYLPLHNIPWCKQHIDLYFIYIYLIYRHTLVQACSRTRGRSRSTTRQGVYRMVGPTQAQRAAKKLPTLERQPVRMTTGQAFTGRLSLNLMLLFSTFSEEKVCVMEFVLF